MISQTGYLITFEGGEGTGKTTQIHRISEHLSEIGVVHTCLREPGGTEIGDQLRSLVHDLRYMGVMEWMTEVGIYMSARAQIVGEKIKPMLASGGVVLLDRFRDSSVVYQGYARGVGAGRIDALNDFFAQGLLPDLTIYFDLDPEVGIARRRTTEEWTRMDAQSLEFHYQVRKAYRALCSFNDENRWEMIDANRTKDEVYEDVWKIVEDRLVSKGILEGGKSCRERE